LVAKLYVTFYKIYNHIGSDLLVKLYSHASFYNSEGHGATVAPASQIARF